VRHRSLALVVVLAAAVTLTAVATGGSHGTRQRVAITMRGLPEGTFVLTPLGAGALSQDSGTATIRYGAAQEIMRSGQSVSVFRPTFTLVGKRGRLTIRERNEWVDVGNGYGVATGTWTIVRGDGVYAGIRGGGRTGHAGLGARWYARQEGYVALP